MIVDVKDASFRVGHGGRIWSWSISAYQHQPVYAIISRTREGAGSVQLKGFPVTHLKFSLTGSVRSRHY